MIIIRYSLLLLCIRYSLIFNENLNSQFICADDGIANGKVSPITAFAANPR